MGRRQIVSTITMLVLIGILAAGAIWGWRALFAPPAADPRTTEAAPSCTPEQIKAGQRIRSRQIRVSVFNSGTRAGLAGDTLNLLLKRGFRRGAAGNAPDDVEVRHVEVWSTVENDPRARLVARQFGKKVPIRFPDQDLGPGIDVIVGDRFDRLVQAPRELKLRRAQKVCVPVVPTDPEVVPEE